MTGAGHEREIGATDEKDLFGPRGRGMHMEPRSACNNKGASAPAGSLKSGLSHVKEPVKSFTEIGSHLQPST